MNFKIHSSYLRKKDFLLKSILAYDSNQNILVNGSRNQIKIAHIDGVPLAIKSFKIPNYFNRIIYAYFRKPKAKRSYEHAKFLLENNIGTPQPIAYFKNKTSSGLKDTYYVCEYLPVDLTLRELLTDENHPDRDTILRQFTQFTYTLHENGIEFLDHSPGNTLIRKVSTGVYKFFLVDLNRMKFHTKMSFNRRMKNLRRLTPNKDIIRLISEEYSKLSGEPMAAIYKKASTYTNNFFLGFNRKRRFKTFLSL